METPSARITLGRFTTEDQPLHTIVLNASNAYITDVRGFHVSPIRNTGNQTSNVLMYDPSTREIIDVACTDVLSLQSISEKGSVTDISLQLTNKVTSLTADGNIIVRKNVSAAGKVLSYSGFVGDGRLLSNISYPQIGNTFPETMHFTQALTGDGGLLTNVYLGRNAFEDTIQFASNIIVDGHVIGDGSLLSNISLDQVVGAGNTAHFGTVQANTFLGDGGLLSNITLAHVVAQSNTITETVHLGDIYAGTYFGDGGLLSNITLAHVVAQCNTVSETTHFNDITVASITGDGCHLSNIHTSQLVIPETMYFGKVVTDGSLISNIHLAQITVPETVTFTTVCAETFLGNGELLTNVLVQHDNTVASRITFADGLLGDGGLLSNISLQTVCDQSNYAREIVADTFIGDGSLLSNITLNQVAQFGNTISGDIIVEGTLLADGGHLSNITLERVCTLNNTVSETVHFTSFDTKASVGFGAACSRARVTVHNDVDINGLGEAQLIQLSGSIEGVPVELGQINSYIKSNNGTTSGWGGGIVFKTKNPHGNITPKVVIDANGYMGIGTLFPKRVLDVNGDVSANRVYSNTRILMTFKNGLLSGDMLGLHYGVSPMVNITEDIQNVQVKDMPNGAELKVPIHMYGDFGVLVIHKFDNTMYFENRVIKKSWVI